MNFLTCILNLTIVSQDEPHSLIASLCLGLPSHRILSVSGVCYSPIGRLDPCSSDVIIWKKKKTRLVLGKSFHTQTYPAGLL